MCLSCGHDAQVPRVSCQCPRCRRDPLDDALADFNRRAAALLYGDDADAGRS